MRRASGIKVYLTVADINIVVAWNWQPPEQNILRLSRDRGHRARNLQTYGQSCDEASIGSVG